MVVCGVSVGKEISFIRNNLKWFNSCLTQMHSKDICLIGSLYEWQNEHRDVFILPKVSLPLPKVSLSLSLHLIQI